MVRIMDYEKKYKEALELARVAAFNGHQSLMEGIFPELAESKDEKTRKRIIALVNAHGQGMYKDDMLAWLEKIEKQGEQKPQRMISAEAKEALYDKPACAWSEEDEKEYKYVLKFVDNILNNCGNKKDYEHCKRCYDWLKSLKDEYTWKPSEKQMEALNAINVTGGISYAGQGQELIDLYKDLKKLRKVNYESKRFNDWGLGI